MAGLFSKLRKVADALRPKSTIEPEKEVLLLKTVGTQTESRPNSETCLNRLLQALNTMRQKSSKTDITLRCGSQKFDAHKEVIAAFCPFFDSALKKNSGSAMCCNEIEVPDVSPESMEVILSFIYTRGLKNVPRDRGSVLKLLEDANRLQMHNLVECGFKFFVKYHLKTTSFIDACEVIASLRNEYCLLEITSFLAANFRDITESEDFLLLNPDRIKDVLQHSDMDKTCMDHVVTSVLQWTDFNKSNRVQYLSEFWGILSEMWCAECLNDIVKEHISFYWNAQITDRLTHLLLSQESAKTKQDCLGCFMSDSREGVIRIGFIDTDHIAWKELKTTPLANFEMVPVTYGCHVFCFGDEEDNPHMPSTLVVKYCPFTNTILSSEESLVVPVTCAGAGLLGGYVFVVNGNSTAKTVQRYNPKDCTCQLVASTNYCHAHPLVSAFNNALFVFGSRRSGEVGNFIERYDPTSDQWTVITQITGEHWLSVSAFWNSQIFLFKNFNLSYENSKFEIFDTTLQRWTEMKYEGGPADIRSSVACEVNEKLAIFVTDGHARLHKFDVGLSTWKKGFEPLNNMLMSYVSYTFFRVSAS